MKILLVITLCTYFILLPLKGLEAIEVTIQAEDGASTTAEKNYRSGATNGLAVLLKQGGTLDLMFEIIGNETCEMQVADILYSNDGMSDKLSLFLNKTSIGEVITRADSRNGFLWNQVLSTGPVGNLAETREGVYNLTVNATSADEYGVEIDSVSLLLMNCSNATKVKIHRIGYIYYEHQSCTCETENIKNNFTNYEISIIVITCVTCVITLIVQVTVHIGIVILKKKCSRQAPHQELIPDHDEENDGSMEEQLELIPHHENDDLTSNVYDSLNNDKTV